VKLTNYMRQAFINAIIQDVPQVDYDSQLRKLIHDEAVALLPPKVQALMKDPVCAPYLNYAYWTSKGVHQAQHIPSPRFDSVKFGTEASIRIAEMIKVRDDQALLMKSLRDKVHAVAYSVSTRKALAAALPEFEKYLPADEAKAIRALPVVANVVADLVKAGWPKGQAKAAPSPAEKPKSVKPARKAVTA